MSDKKDQPVIASIKVDGKGRISNFTIDTNVMTSSYGRSNYEDFMNRNIAKGNLLYDVDEGIINKIKRSDERVQFPVIASDGNNIPQTTPKVKPSHSQEGSWQERLDTVYRTEGKKTTDLSEIRKGKKLYHSV